MSTVLLPPPLPITLHTPFETSVNPSGWQVVGRWLGRRHSYTAQVIAQRAKSKKNLAFLITGDENDFGLLGGQETAKRGERISVVPFSAIEAECEGEDRL